MVLFVLLLFPILAFADLRFGKSRNLKPIQTNPPNTNAFKVQWIAAYKKYVDFKGDRGYYVKKETNVAIDPFDVSIDLSHDDDTKFVKYKNIGQEAQHYWHRLAKKANDAVAHRKNAKWKLNKEEIIAIETYTETDLVNIITKIWKQATSDQDAAQAITDLELTLQLLYTATHKPYRATFFAGGRDLWFGMKGLDKTEIAQQRVKEKWDTNGQISHGPASTSKSKFVAINFAHGTSNNKGVVFKVSVPDGGGAAFGAVDVSWISKWGDSEREVTVWDLPAKLITVSDKTQVMEPKSIDASKSLSLMSYDLSKSRSRSVSTSQPESKHADGSQSQYSTGSTAFISNLVKNLVRYDSDMIENDIPIGMHPLPYSDSAEQVQQINSFVRSNSGSISINSKSTALAKESIYNNYPRYDDNSGYVEPRYNQYRAASDSYMPSELSSMYNVYAVYLIVIDLMLLLIICFVSTCCIGVIVAFLAYGMEKYWTPKNVVHDEVTIEQMSMV